MVFLLLHLYVAFFKWEKSGAAGDKPDQGFVSNDKVDLAAAAVQGIPAFGCLLPFSGWKAEVIFNRFTSLGMFTV